MQPAKCHLWHPGEVQRDSTAQHALEQLQATIPATTGHLKIMGSEGGRQYETAIGPDHSLAAEAAQARAETAIALCRHLQELIDADLGHARLQVTWSL